MNRASGIDISHWDGKVDFNKAFVSGASFVYMKASQGTWTDSTFIRNWQASKDAGILRGSYCYLDFGWSEIEQAELFVSTMGGDYGELPPVLDLEMDPAPHGLSAALVSGKAWNFLKYVESATGKIPMLYCGYYYWNSWGSNAIGWTHFPFWLAWYAPEWFIKLRSGGTGAPKPWKDWKFWQYTDRADGVAFGCQSKGVDANWFNGTADDLRAVVVPPPPIPTYTDYAVNRYRINVREGSNINSQWLSYANLGDILHIDKIENGYAHAVGLGWIYLKYLTKK